MIEKIELVVPFVHANGDRRDTLLERLEAAYHAVTDSMDLLRQCAPNGRDAYPVDGLMQRLEAQHRQRQEYLKAVADSLEAESIELAKGNA
jgi:hypothetical protein